MIANRVDLSSIWPSPPIRSNDRLHWAAKAKLTKAVRDAVCLLGRDQQPVTESVAVTLTWTVTDRRRRDSGASSPTLKAAIDGLVDAGVFPGDHWEVVREERCRIELGDAPGLRIDWEATA